jgi:hypothetical protein
LRFQYLWHQSVGNMTAIAFMLSDENTGKQGALEANITHS